jgi:peptidoglycan/LPS O-acetylase OafA/YrhL
MFSFIFAQTNLGVSYFFILSGFVMIIAYGDKSKINTFDFFKNRFARIYPVYLLSLLLLLFWAILVKWSIDYKGLFLNLFVIQAWIPGKAMSFNYPAWSLSIEFFFYFLFPFVFNYIYSKKKIIIYLFPILLIWMISQIISTYLVHSDFNNDTWRNHDLMYCSPFLHLNEFLIGNLAGMIFIKHLIGKKRNYDLIILFLFLILVILLKYPFGLDYHNGLLALIFIPIILFISINKGILTKLANRNFFIFLGEISYGIYILQYPIFTWSSGVLQYFHVENTWICFYIPLVILIFASGFSYIVFEKPLRRIIKNIGKTKTPI